MGSLLEVSSSSDLVRNVGSVLTEDWTICGREQHILWVVKQAATTQDFLFRSRSTK